MDWQPIETAPKDVYVRLKLSDGAETWGDFDTTLTENPAFPNGMWCLKDSSCGLGEMDSQPTHWMPFSEPLG